MSQEGLVDVIGAHPVIPTTFDADSGSAVPILNVLEIFTSVAAAGSTPITTTGSGKTITITPQISQALAATDATAIGLCAFDSSDFNVDANGFVSLSATAGGTSFTVDAATPPGTNPVAPSGTGLITVTGGQVAAGTTANVIQTNSLAANTFTIEIQRSTVAATPTVGSNGVCHFSSADFTQDSDGFVELANSGPFVESVTGTTDRITSTGGVNPVIDIAATYVGQTSITTLGTIATGTWNSDVISEAYGGTNQSTYATGDILYASAVNTLSKLTATTDGFVLTLSGGVPVWAAEANQGDVVGPASATDNDLCSFDGATGKLIKDSGILSSNVVTASSNLTDYAVICGNGGSKGVQSIAGVGTSGQVLTSNGAGMLPTFQDAAGGVAGPVSSTDRAISTWNGTGGDTLYDNADVRITSGGVIEADNGISFDSGTNTLANYIAPTSWTPVLDFGGASTGITYDGNDNKGWYSRVGNTITVFCQLILTNKGSATGDAHITGFPGNSLGGFNFSQAVRCNNITFTSGNFLQGRILNNTFYFSQVSPAGTTTNITNSNFSNTSSLIFAGSYFIS